jgi:hypothetical protein
MSQLVPPATNRVHVCTTAARVGSLIFAVSILLLSLSLVSAAQQVGATLTGTVTDPSGAVVPGATVIVHNEDSGTDVRTVTTGGTGGYNVPNIPAGHYTVRVSTAGFQTYVANNVILNVAEKHTLDVTLQAGQVSQRVEVTAQNAPIQTTTAEESGTVTGEQVRELALNNRNFEQLVLLQPGVSSQLPDKVGFGLQNNTSISINGARTGSNNWMVDGADINDSGSNGTLLNTPGIDAIQEFTLERSNYDAAFGRNGGGQIVVATKSGTNQFHGSAFEFNRNNYYNANTFADRQAIAFGGNPVDFKTPIERYNDFGFTVGGPFIIPKLYHPSSNRTFFFWSEEWRKASLPASNQITVPTGAQLSGVFTTPITVAPAGCVTAAGGTYTIAPSCYSTNAKAYLNAFMSKYPADPSGFLTSPYSQLNNFRQDIIRLDQNVGDRLRLYARYMQDSVPQNFPFSLWGGGNYPGVENTSVNAPGRNLVVNASTTINPRVVNEIEFVNAWGAINATLNGIANSPAFTSQLTNNTAYPDPYGRAPNVAFSGGTYAGLGNGSAPYFERNIDRNLFDNLSMQHGNHTIRTGFTSMWMQKTENASSGAANFSFSGTNANDPFANFLLGQADTYSQPNKDTIPHLRYTNFEAYVQDDWKVTRRLTLNLGIRYSYFPSPTDSNNTLVNFDPSRFNPALAPTSFDANGNGLGPFNAATYANGLIFPRGAACSSAQAISPEVACSPFGNRVNPNSNKNWGPRIGMAFDPFGDGKWAIRAGYGIFYDRTLNGIWEQNAFADPPLVQTTTINNNPASTLDLFDNPLGGAPAAAPTGPVALVATGTPRFKVPSYQDFNVSVQHQFFANTVVEVGYVGTRGSHLLGDVDLNQPTVAARLANPTADVNALRPFLGYATITSRAPLYTSNYNSLQVSAQRAFSRGLTFAVSYTWSKLLTTNPYDRGLMAYDTYNLKLNYGPSLLNTPQIFTASYVYELPFFKGQKGFVGHVLGGWELSGIVSVQTGQSQIISQSNDPWAMAGYPGGLGMTRSSNYSILPDQVGNPHGPKTVTEFFNTAAFTPAVGHFGTARPGAVLGPGFQLWDTSLMKNFKFGEKASLQLRLETFNTFNHGSPSNIDTGLDSSTFGQVSGWHDPRNLQIGAKLRF